MVNNAPMLFSGRKDMIFPDKLDHGGGIYLQKVVRNRVVRRQIRDFWGKNGGVLERIFGEMRIYRYICRDIIVFAGPCCEGCRGDG